MNNFWLGLVFFSTQEAQGSKTFYFGLHAEPRLTETKAFYMEKSLIFHCFYFCVTPKINMHYKERLFIFV